MDKTMHRRPEPMNFALPTGTDAASVRARVVMMERLLERSFTIPGINMPVGLDALVGLVPVIGEVVTAAMGAYIVWEAKNLGVPKWKLARMGANVLFDTAIGAIPLIGDAADLVFRSNTRNLRILLKHIDKHHPETRVIDR
ncbi:DUF4112 domain-containing protein [Porphyrobacter sp. CACIAM 03H1]|jgi:hypothetical protein|uniref:DUF4112 domain-containing protein n=1 Tax=Porphyrobacter sp. CACIAM 03H1 TaxID=2003315 RepID=UPI000B5AB82D|nr:DUF4112 domain-containing protein [Porphyrobacter sp. CACIAM 03H1]ASJ89636.1 hypothetical protein CBR61_00910 [Porphyrobacter sp. CACIAM 03H1]